MLGQTFHDFELIIIDDCSDDDSLAIIESFDDHRVRLLKSSERLGICKALNLGIENSRGSFLARMDADDICHPRRLERQVRFLNRHTKIGFCGTWVRRFGKDQIPQLYRLPVGESRVRAYAAFENPMVHSSVMFRREVFDSMPNGYRHDFINAEDYDLWTRLFEVTKGDNLAEVLLDYRVHAQSVTMQKTEAMDQVACRILERELGRLGVEPTEAELKFHRLWSTGRLASEDYLQEMKSIERWLIRLNEANKRSKAFDTAAFLWASREIWFGLCYRIQALGHPVLKRFFQSPLSRGDLKSGAILMAAKAKRML